MLSRSPLTKLLGPSALLMLLASTSVGCNGCNDPTLECDANGNNCEICDGYGCHPADPDHGVGGASGEGGAGGSGGSQPACDAKVTTCPCSANSACADGTQCVGGLCIHGCDYSYECGPGKVCANGQCSVGCDEKTPCAEAGTTCDKGVCVPDPANPACSATKPCDSGKVCVNGLCSAACKTNKDCSAGEICNAATGACIADPAPQPGCTSAACQGVGQQCMADGFCHYPCTDSKDCQLHDSRFVACDAGFCKTREEVAPECTIEKPCPEGKDCISNKCL